MSRSLYRRYLTLCERWGTDPTKKGRDFGEFLRQQVAKEFRHGETTELSDLKGCEQKLESLLRLVSNCHKKQYAPGDRATASGLTVEQCKELTSTEALEEIKKFKFSTWEKLKNTFKLRN